MTSAASVKARVDDVADEIHVLHRPVHGTSASPSGVEWALSAKTKNLSQCVVDDRQSRRAARRSTVGAATLDVAMQ